MRTKLRNRLIRLAYGNIHLRPDLLPLFREAGGLDLGSDPAAMLSKMIGQIKTYSEKDIAYATYIFEYAGGMTGDPRVKKFAGQLAEVYARNFAGWLAYAFVERADRWGGIGLGDELGTLASEIRNWLLFLPESIVDNKLAEFEIPHALRFAVDFHVLERIFQRIQRMVSDDFRRQSKTASLKDLPISYDEALGYVIPFSPQASGYDKALRELGFHWQRYHKLWYTEALTPDILSQLPQLGKFKQGPPLKPIAPKEINSLVEWYAGEWLPTNLDRIRSIFNTYSRSTDKIALNFVFSLTTKGDVTVEIMAPGRMDSAKKIDKAVHEVLERYEDEPGREPWIQAVKIYEKLKSVKGIAAIRLIDLANNLEHSNGSMIEHMPPGIRSWYPAFLDFKHTADILQMVKRIKSQSLRELAEALLPVSDQTRRLIPPARDSRTVKGLVLEIMAQQGRSGKQRMFEETQKQHPELADEIFKELRSRGIRVHK